MQYRKDRYGNDISILGYGCMRFSKKTGKIEYEKTEQEILHAIDNGVNYFDTAYIYGGSEECLGRILSENNVRDKVKIATKLPQYLINKENSIEKYFSEQCRRLRTDHIDYYLMHMLTDIKAWNNLVGLGIKEWIADKKKSGAIGQIGFSFHGNTEMFLKILNAYDWDFCQIQYNYLDEHTQAGKEGLLAAAAKGIPVIIMEPLRGGKLVNMLPEKALKRINGYSIKRSPAEWAFRWLWNQKEVTCVLSGMNSMEMLDENLCIANNCMEGEFTPDDFNLIEDVKNSINEKVRVPCTGCGYCMPCPKNVDIPGAFRCYNRMYTEKKSSGRLEYAQVVSLKEEPVFPSQCIECGKCEMHCPQHIEIRKKLKEAKKALMPFPYNVVIKIARKFMINKKKR